MKVSGLFGALLVPVAVVVACGDDTKPKPSPALGGEGGGENEPAGGNDARAGTPNMTGGTGGSAGTAGTSGDAGEPAVGGNAGEPGTAGGAGEDGAGGAPVMETLPITLEVHGSEGVRAISPLIYGANTDGLDCADAKARFTFCKSRSAAFSTYNWETNASNAGQSDCNENNAALSASTAPGAAITDLIDVAAGAQAATLITLPMLDRVAADVAGGTAAPDCSGDVSKGANYLDVRFKQNRAVKGAPPADPPDTSDGFVNQDELVAFLAAEYPNAQLLFSLDTQPELWHLEHPKVRSAPLTYDEQVALSVEYATMLRDTWVEAEILGLGGFGYLAAHRQVATSPDYATKGVFVSYLLAGMKAASDSDGRRLLDYVDLHWFAELYPGGQRIIGEDASEASVLERVQAPRSLWDPEFVENSWITVDLGGEPIQLLGWLQEAIDDNYPDTKLAISEWAFGGGQHISGGIAAADALGIFGQKGVALAGAVSFSPDTEPYLVGAFQAFRNYDGQGSAFGDTSVAASSSDVALASIYASVDQADDSRMVLIAINRSAANLEAALNIDHDTAYQSLTPYRVADGQPEPAALPSVAATSANQFALVLPPYSVSVLVPSE